MTEPMLVVKNLCLDILKDGKPLPILRDVSFEIHEGENWGIAGESGAGKSMTMYCLTAMLPRHTVRTSGEILYREEDGCYTNLADVSWRERQRYCSKKTCLILQDSINALNPFERVGDQWVETARFHHPNLGKDAVLKHILEQMEAFGITGGPEVARKYPHQLSGGMRQRIAIAMALESEAKLLIADEPTTSLDTINQRRAVEFIDNLRRERGLSMLYITHNLGIIQAVCENVIIMKDGGIVEQGRTREVFSHPKHAYVRRLLDETRRIQR